MTRLVVTATVPPDGVDPNPVAPWGLTGDMWRCDNLTAVGTTEVPSKYNGCVNEWFTPTLTYDAKAKPLVAPVARHVKWAQSNLPQHPGLETAATRVPLIRQTETVKDRNYAEACPASFPRTATNNSCDEYPMASARTPGQQASTMAVPSSANSSQGGITGNWYQDNRVVPGDKFWVATNIPDDHTGSVQPHAGPEAKFNAYSDTSTCATWSGGDATNSVLLPGGSRAWFFSDSYLGSPAQRKTFFDTSSVHNSIVRQSSTGTLSTITGGNTCRERDTSVPFLNRYARSIAEAPDAASGGFFWTGDQQVVGTDVVKFYYHGRPSSNVFETDYGAVARIPVSTLQTATTLAVTPTPLRCASGPAVVWGNMTLDLSADSRFGYDYVYGRSADRPGVAHTLYLARTSKANLAAFSTWQFYTGTDSSGAALWSATGGCGASAPLPLADASGGSVAAINGAIWLIEDAHPNGEFTGTHIAAHPAETPWGFTERSVALFTPPENHHDYPYFYMWYEVRLQPGLTDPGDPTPHVILTYNVNSAAVDTGCASANAYDGTIYRPRFIKVPVDWFSIYDATLLFRSATTAQALLSPSGAAASTRYAADGRRVLTNPRLAAPPTGAPSQPTAAALVAPTTPGGLADWTAHFGGSCPTVPVPSPVQVATGPDGSVRLAWPAVGSDVWWTVHQCDQSATGTCGGVEPPCEGTGRAGFSTPLVGGLWLTVPEVGFVPVTSSADNGHTFIWYVCSQGAQNLNPVGTGGNGGASADVSARATMVPPTAPTGLKVVLRSGTSITASWNPVSDPSPSVYYAVYYRDVTSGSADVWGTPWVESTTTTISVPNATHVYEITVKATNIGGFSPASTPVRT